MPKQKCHHKGNVRIIKPWGLYYRCQFCNQEFESLKRKLVNWFIWKWRFYCGRGESFIADINGLINTMGGVGVAFLLLDKWFDSMPGGDVLVGIWVFQKALVFFLGYMDYHYWHIFQMETTYGVQFSPSSVEMLTRLRNIEEKVVPEKHKEESVLDNIGKNT